MLPKFHSLRCHPRLSAFLALLALCLQLVATGIGAVHAAERLANSSGAIEICTPAGIVRITADGTEYPTTQPGGQQCPFCATAAGSPPLLAVALSFFVSGPAPADYSPQAPADLPPTAPDQRHAPNRAPPPFFA
ncbi:DUF2946 family protein [Azovibrio restrictus]|uniref:DUF2946 family protein n=1 Tax=Azovibrio restrictus TaxID=146938 RepID=UPI0026EC9039|nr:DUF2946 family protein [Azovibrio restrictus]MDD3482177.1 DUF2946 family protein [Azovibrio restrictus]